MAQAQRQAQADKLLNDQSSNQYFYCNIEVAGAQIPPKSIAYLAIREWVLPTSIVPRLELAINDDGMLTELKVPYYNRAVFIQLGRSENDPNPIQLEFDIYDYTIDRVADEGRSIVNISGLIAMTDPFVIPDKPILFEQKTSQDIMTSIGSAMIGNLHDTYSFTAQNATPMDTMNWIQSYESNMDFIKNVLNYSFIGATDCLMAYVDVEAKFNYKGLQTAFTTAPVFTARYDPEIATSQALNEMEQKAVQKGYTAEQARNDIWYSSVNFRDYSGTVRNQRGFKTQSTWFDRATSTGNSNEFSINMNNTDADIYQDYVTNNKTYYEYKGEVSTTNQYNDYQDAFNIRQNMINQLFAQSVLLEINAFSNVKLMDTVDLQLNADIKSDSGFPINERLSGVYIVGGITHTVGGPGSIYKKVLNLFRTGVNSAGFAGVE